MFIIQFSLSDATRIIERTKMRSGFLEASGGLVRPVGVSKRLFGSSVAG